MKNGRRVGKAELVRKWLKPLSRRQILLCVPMYGKPAPATMLKVQKLMYHWAMLETTIDIVPFFPIFSVISHSRNEAVKTCLGLENPIGLCFIDDDMDFPVGGDGPGHVKGVPGFNPLVRLVEREKDVVGYLCTSRGMQPNVKMACGTWKPNGEPECTEDPAIVGYETPDPVQMPWIGMAFTYIRIEALRTMAEKFGGHRLFNLESNWTWNEETNAVISRALASAAMGRDHDTLRDELKAEIALLVRKSDQPHEDTSFCRKATDCGLEVWVERSVEVCHIGEYKYGRKDWLGYQEIQRQKREREAALKTAEAAHA